MLTGIVSSVAIFTAASQRVLEPRQNLVATGTNDEDVLKPDSAPARPVDRGLERQHHPLLDPDVTVRGDPWFLRPGGSDPMAGVVCVCRPVLGEQVAYLAVDVPCHRAGPAQRDALVEGAADSVEAAPR